MGGAVSRAEIVGTTKGCTSGTANAADAGRRIATTVLRRCSLFSIIAAGSASATIFRPGGTGRTHWRKGTVLRATDVHRIAIRVADATATTYRAWGARCIGGIIRGA